MHFLLLRSKWLEWQTRNICLSLWNFHELQIPPKKCIWVIYILCIVHIVHRVPNLNSSSHPWWKKFLKKAMIQCMTSEVQFCYVCLKCICICAFSQLEISIHAIGTNNQIEGGNKLCDFLQQSNQRKNCDNKIYCKIFLVSPLHISYNLWTWLFVTCSHMHWKFWKFVSLY